MALLFALNEGGYSSGHCSGLSPDSLFMQRDGRRSLHHQNAGKIRRCFYNSHTAPSHRFAFTVGPRPSAGLWSGYISRADCVFYQIAWNTVRIQFVWYKIPCNPEQYKMDSRQIARHAE